MTRRRAIGERLRRAGSKSVRVEIAHDWAAAWRKDHEHTLAALEQVLGDGDIDAAGQYLGQLKALNAKAMSALPMVIDEIGD